MRNEMNSGKVRWSLGIVSVVSVASSDFGLCGTLGSEYTTLLCGPMVRSRPGRNPGIRKGARIELDQVPMMD